jgi:hypothetical protein
MKTYKFVIDDFYVGAKQLRKVFENKFSDPKKTNSNRFVWDFWHVPDQYTLLRTPADAFFPKKEYQQFLAKLGHWAWKNLGCAAITPPWLSYYIEGCEQKLHSDVPHGPWAFVYSLCPSRIRFSGGETEIIRPEVLEYWNHFSQQTDRELHSFVDRIKPKFNRLIVFDPRLPHGVSRVSGNQDPREARLVLHGWFTSPKPYIEGPLKPSEVAGALNEGIDQFVDELLEVGQWNGILSISLEVGASGRVKNVSVLANTLRVSQQESIDPKILEKRVKAIFHSLVFAKKGSSSKITLPLRFQ